MTAFRRTVVGGLLGLALLSREAWAAPSPPPCPRQIEPHDTSGFGFVQGTIGDPASNDKERDSHHYCVYTPTGSSPVGHGHLLVFFPGTGAPLDSYQDFMITAASKGYHVVGLGYPQDGNILTTLCKHKPASCFGDIRTEVFDGTDKSTISKVSAHKQDSIRNRLHATLHYLASKFPGEGWGAFFDGGTGNTLWDKIAFAGHSQGAGYAAFVASREKVYRVIMLSGPNDACDDNVCTGQPGDIGKQPVKPAGWVVASNPTPSKVYYALGHTEDIADAAMAVPRIQKLRRDWHELGLPGGGPLTVDGLSAAHLLALSPAPHTLLSSENVWGDPATISVDDQQGAAHGHTATKKVHYEAAWTYMLTSVN